MPNANTSDYRKHAIKPLKRIGAFVADLVLFMITTISLFSLAINPLVKESFKKEMLHKLRDEVLDSDNHYYDTYLHFYAYYCSEVATFSDEKKNYTISWVNDTIYGINSEDNILFALTNNDINLPLRFSDTAKVELNNYLSGEVNATSQKYYDAYIQGLFICYRFNSGN